MVPPYDPRLTPRMEQFASQKEINMELYIKENRLPHTDPNIIIEESILLVYEQRFSPEKEAEMAQPLHGTCYLGSATPELLETAKLPRRWLMKFYKCSAGIFVSTDLSPRWNWLAFLNKSE